MPNTKSRVIEIDILRGIAVFLMIAYHLMWDLNYFNVLTIDFSNYLLVNARRLVAGLFIILVGISLSLSYQAGRRKNISRRLWTKRHVQRGLLIFALGMIITAATFLSFPDEFIFFGILHFIGLSIVISCYFTPYKYTNLLAAAAIFTAAGLLQNSITDKLWLASLGFQYADKTLDLYPLLPWLGLILLGLFLGNILYPENSTLKAENKQYKPKTLLWASRHH